MARKEQEPPKHIQDFYKKDKQLDVLQTRTLRSWGEAHASAQKNVLKDDYSLLKKKDHRRKYTDHIVDELVKDAKEHFKQKGDLDAVTEARILRAYAGTTRDEIQHLIEEHKDEYEYHKDSVANRAAINIIAQLRPIAYEHLDAEKHLEDVTEHTGLEKGDLPELMHKSGLAKVLKDYDTHGHVRKKTIERLKENPRRYEQNIEAYLRE